MKSGRLDEAARAERLGRLSVTASAEDLADADLVIEAVFDDLAVKTELFARLDGIVRPDAILATNTSYLDPDVIAATTARPERVLGLHFFSPANIMRLVEVVRCARTAPDVLATGLAVREKARQAARLFRASAKGSSATASFPPIAARQNSCWKTARCRRRSTRRWKPMASPWGLSRCSISPGWKSPGRGASARRQRAIQTNAMSRSPTGSAKPAVSARRPGAAGTPIPDGKRTVDPEVTALIEAARAKKGIVPRAVETEEIVSRLLGAMTMEGDKLLAEGIAQRASDIDLVMING